MKWATGAMLDAALNHLRSRVVGYHLTIEPVTEFLNLAAASLASGTATISAPTDNASGGRRVTVTCNPSTATIGFAAVPLHLSLVSSGTVEYVTSVPAPAAPVAPGEQLNVTPWTIELNQPT